MRFERSCPGFWHRQASHCWPLGSTARIIVPSIRCGHVASEEGVHFVLDDAAGTKRRLPPSPSCRRSWMSIWEVTSTHFKADHD